MLGWREEVIVCTSFSTTSIIWLVPLVFIFSTVVAEPLLDLSLSSAIRIRPLPPLALGHPASTSQYCKRLLFRSTKPHLLCWRKVASSSSGVGSRGTPDPWAWELPLSFLLRPVRNYESLVDKWHKTVVKLS